MVHITETKDNNNIFLLSEINMWTWNFIFFALHELRRIMGTRPMDTVNYKFYLRWLFQCDLGYAYAYMYSNVKNVNCKI